MTPWQSRVTKLTQRMADDMKLRNFAPSTIDAYTYHVGRFAEFLGKSPESASPDLRPFPEAEAIAAAPNSGSIVARGPSKRQRDNDCVIR